MNIKQECTGEGFRACSLVRALTKKLHNCSIFLTYNKFVAAEEVLHFLTKVKVQIQDQHIYLSKRTKVSLFRSTS